MIVNNYKIEAGAALQHADLQHADLRGADLQHADLRGADLRDADLRGADLRDADLRGADLRYADLHDADLRGANLRYADLQHADLRYADLRYADLRGANLRHISAGCKCVQVLDLQWRVVITNDVIAIGCQQHTLEQWSSFEDDTIAAMHSDALAFWRLWKQPLLQIATNLGI